MNAVVEAPKVRNLDTVAEEIRKTHNTVLKSLRNSVNLARDTGTLLIEAKEQVEQAEKGTWLTWVQENCKMSVAQAQRYMRIADNFAELLEKAKDPNKLSMTEALKLLSPKSGKTRTNKKKDAPRFVVESEADLNNLVQEGNRQSFTKDSPEANLLEQTVAAFTRKVLTLANKKTKVADSPASDQAKLAVGLVMHLRTRLEASLVVETKDQAQNAA